MFRVAENIQSAQKIVLKIVKFVNTLLGTFAILQIVKTPNTLYSFCYTPQNYLMKYLLRKDSSSAAVLLLYTKCVGRAE